MTIKNILTTLILTISSLTIFAQDKVTEELKTLSDDKQFDEIFVPEKRKDFVCKMMIDLQIIDNDFNYIGRGKPSNRTLISSLIEVCKKECFFSSDLTNTEIGRIFCKKMKLCNLTLKMKYHPMTHKLHLLPTGYLSPR